MKPFNYLLMLKWCIYSKYCIRDGFIFVNFASQNLATISTSIYVNSNENIRKITKFSPREFPHQVQNCENICTRKLWRIQYLKTHWKWPVIDESCFITLLTALIWGSCDSGPALVHPQQWELESAAGVEPRPVWRDPAPCHVCPVHAGSALPPGLHDLPGEHQAPAPTGVVCRKRYQTQTQTNLSFNSGPDLDLIKACTKKQAQAHVWVVCPKRY